MREEIQNHINSIKLKIENRKRILLEDDRNHCIVENRILSSSMANIPGIQQHLHHVQLAKESSGINEIKDPWSHNSYSKSEIQLKYQTTKRFS